MPYSFALGYAALALLFNVLCFPIGDLDRDTDFYGDLVLAAKQIDRGELSVRDYPYKGPIFPMAVAGVHRVIGDWYRSAVIVNVLAAAGALILLYRLLASLFDARVAACATVLASLVREFALLAHGTGTDLLFLLLASVSMLLVCTRNDRPRAILAAGVFSALAFLTRYNGVSFTLAALVALALGDPSRQTRARRVRACALFLAAFFVVWAPWLAFTWIQTGSPLFTRGAQNILAGLFGDPRYISVQQDPELTGFRNVLAYDPVHAVAQSAANLVQHARRDLTDLLGFPDNVLAVLGGLGLVLRRPSRRQWCFYTFGATYFLLLGPIFYAERFSVPLVGPYLAAGIAFLFQACPPRFRWVASLDARTVSLRERATRALASGPRAARIGSHAALWLLGFACLVVPIRRVLAAERVLLANRPLALVQAAAVLQKHAAASGKRAVMARKGHLALHAGLDYVRYPKSNGWTLSQLLAYARDHGAGYIFYGRAEFVLMTDYRFLSRLDSVPGLREIFRAQGERLFECTDYTPQITEAESQAMLVANLESARSRKETALLSRAATMLAQYFLDHDATQEALPYAEQAVSLLEGAAPGSALGRQAADGHYNLAIVLMELGRPSEAWPHFARTLEYFQHYGTPDDVAGVQEMLAMVSMQLQDVADAVHRLRSARGLYSKLADRARVDSLLVAAGRAGPDSAIKKP